MALDRLQGHYNILYVTRMSPAELETSSDLVQQLPGRVRDQDIASVEGIVSRASLTPDQWEQTVFIDSPEFLIQGQAFFSTPAFREDERWLVLLAEYLVSVKDELRLSERVRSDMETP
jgi:hypothetical protein